MTDPQHEETFADTERKLREIITTLRAQLAEARAERDVWEIDAKRNHQAAEIEFARAEQAEAALAAQIEADMEMCGQCMGSGYGGHPDSGVSCPVCGGSGGVRNQPHDRTALDMQPTVSPELLATTNDVAALVEAAGLLLDAYKAVLVLHRVMDKHGLTAGASAAENIADRIVAAHPEFPGLCALRGNALARVKG